MKKFIMGVSVLLAVTATANAQVDALKKAATTTATSATQSTAGKVLTQLASAIKPGSLLSTFAAQKTSWANTASKVSTAVGVAQSAVTLAKGIKPESFKSGFSLDNLVSTASTVKTMAGATGLLKNLEGGIKPEALTSTWNTQRSGWLSALSLLK